MGQTGQPYFVQFIYNKNSKIFESGGNKAHIKYLPRGEEAKSIIVKYDKSLSSDSQFKYNYHFTSIGIQTMPGVKFYIGPDKNDGEITIDSTGIFVLDINSLQDVIQINFKTETLKLVEENPVGYLIVDLTYEKINNPVTFEIDDTGDQSEQGE